MSEDVSLLHEIDEALRADKAMRFWQKYGKLLLAGCATVVALTAASAFWKHHLREEDMKQTHMLLQAKMAAGDARYKDAAQAISGAQVSGRQAGFAKLQEAGYLAQAGDRDKAVTRLKEVIAMQQTETAVHDAALLRLHVLTGSDVSPADQQGRPFTAIARQMKAASLIKEGKNKDAAAILRTAIAEAPLFSPERESAMQMLSLTGESE